MPIRSPFSFVAGDPALDLVNTVAWRSDPARTTDRLDGFAALADWSRQAGVIDPPLAARLAAATRSSRRCATCARTCTPWSARSRRP